MNINHKASFYRWFSVVLCVIASSVLIKEISYVSNLVAAQKAQADFGLFWVFSVYVLPSIALVVVSFVHYLIEKARDKKSSAAKYFGAFFFASLFVVSVPIAIFLLVDV